MNWIDPVYNKCSWGPTVAIATLTLLAFLVWYHFRWKTKHKGDIYSSTAPVFEPMLIAVSLGVCLVCGVLSLYKSACFGRTQGVCEIIVRNPPWLILSGLGAAPAILLTWYWNTSHKQADIKKGEQDVERGHKEIAISRETQITTQFSTSIELLGHEQVAVRIGAIYALERLAETSERDKSNIVETLCAMVRNSKPVEDSSVDTMSPPKICAPEAQAAITVLCRVKRTSGKLNFRGASLPGAKLDNADLTDVDFSGANLSNASFKKTSFRRVDFRETDLRRAILQKTVLIDTTLHKAKLGWANLSEANLNGACLDGADLEATIFDSASLEKASLLEVKLVETSFSEANLQGAEVSSVAKHVSFWGADVRGANISGLIVDNNADFNGALFDDNTRLPINWVENEFKERGMRREGSVVANRVG